MSGKLLIVLLAVCLVSVHAFVKRDTAAAGGDSNTLENFQKQIEEFTKNLGSKASDAFDPENIKKGINDAVTTLQKALDDLKEKTNTPAKA